MLRPSLDRMTAKASGSVIADLLAGNASVGMEAGSISSTIPSLGTVSPRSPISE